MLAQESAVPIFDLPDELLEVLPLDPFEQLDVARKITSIALSTRVSALESEASVLRHTLTDRDNVIADLQAQIESLDASLSETADKLAQADREKESLMRENAVLSNTVKKLNRDVSKLEIFKKTLMQSLQEDDDNSGGAPKVVATPVSSHASFSSQSLVGEDDATLPPSRTSPLRSQFLEVRNSYAEDQETDGRTRVDGKEFFRQVRSRLSYEQFGAFLANVKELNSHKQTKEETLRKADEIFGPDNKDLYAIFEGLITRNVQ
ncbi:uncharacterized protein At4g15545-like isoform X2 [Actinidia eriantha]|uniref:uncharacterized protein At4g15545-like isoform X2 n=1 Tax=Actinidia eriantha TaxID=165200 RepID=UPI002584F176|nr:uncharacterized protein At4g15545-like isoform X2 [Actinidia eriantha]